jgi:hypothetical protein
MIKATDELQMKQFEKAEGRRKRTVKKKLQARQKIEDAINFKRWKMKKDQDAKVER